MGIRGVAVCPRMCQGLNHSVAVQQQGGQSEKREHDLLERWFESV